MASASISTRHFGRDETRDLHHAGGGPDVAEKFAVGAANFFPLGDIEDVDARANNVFERSAGAREGSFNVANGLDGLRVGVADATMRPSGPVAVVPEPLINCRLSPRGNSRR